MWQHQFSQTEDATNRMSASGHCHFKFYNLLLFYGTRKIAPWKITPRKIVPNPNPNPNPNPGGNLLGGNLQGGNFPATLFCIALIIYNLLFLLDRLHSLQLSISLS